MPSSRARNIRGLSCLGLAITVSTGACGPTPIEVSGPVPETPPQPPVALEAPLRPGQVLKVAGPATRPISRRMVTVDARSPRTEIGRFPAGTRVRIAVVETRWNHDPSAPFYDAAGKPGESCGAPGRTCVGGPGVPVMGLILLTTPADASMGAPQRACAPRHRLFIPNGVEFAVPEDTELALAPNDWEDGLQDNAGSIRVQVETTAGRGGKSMGKVKLDVDARRAQTSLGHFTAGQYVRVSVLGGQWTHDPTAPLVGAGGVGKAVCQASGGHLCAGGDARAPRMGLIMLVGACTTSAPRAMAERRFIPEGASFVLEKDSDLALGPNDWEDGCANNAGASIVDVAAELP